MSPEKKMPLMNADFPRSKTIGSQLVAEDFPIAFLLAQVRKFFSHVAMPLYVSNLRPDHAPELAGGSNERELRHSSFSNHAFSLIELLVVVALIALLTTLAVPAVGSMSRSNEITRGQQLIERQLVTARQTAVARNRRVEVRFYKFTDTGAMGSAPTFRAVQAFLIDEKNKATPVGRMAKLPDSVVLNEVVANSSLLGLADKANWDASNDPQVSLPGVGTSYTAKAFQFRPDGSTSLAAMNMWFVSIHSAVNGATSAKPPVNFVTVQVDPVSGSVRSYRP